MIINFEGTTRTLMADMNERFKTATGSAYNEFDVALIMQQIFSLLSYLHYYRYVHRDIKPEHFLLSSDTTLPDTLRLCSLSTVASLAECDSLKGIVGTYLYMAPEMISGKNYDTAVDVWAAGVIMYMLLTGEHPLIDLESRDRRTTNYKEMILKTLQEEGLQTIDDKKPEVKLLKKNTRILLESLLEIDPKKRITAERALRDPWLCACVKAKKEEYITRIEDRLRSTEDLHEILMSIISTICAPTLKILLLDRMCNPCEYARKGGYPEVTSTTRDLYRNLFFVIDRNGNGFLSKEEILGSNFRMSER